MNTDYVLLSYKHTIQTETQLEFFLSNIFDEDTYVQQVKNIILQADPRLEKFGSINRVLSVIKNGLHDSINWKGFIPEDDAKHLWDTAKFEQGAVASQEAYLKFDNPRSAVYWPDPQHKKYPASRIGLHPHVQKHPFIDKNTPIGSAGSCFAIEIAKELQQRQFNYVVTERADDLNQGVLVAGYKPGSEFAPGSFNSGIQFNTANFRHLAEKAFSTREFKKLLIQSDLDGGEPHYADPYREDVYFLTPEAYLADYEKHRNAIKEALLGCEVFILTPGLNECWEFKDGTVMARNPKSASFPFARAKTLTVAENVENLQVFFDLVKAHNPNFKLILSLSPVPFLATTRSKTHHVIEANSHSKSVLRVAIDEVVKNNEDIYYLPSYEYVSYCCSDPWEADDRHVKREVVAEIISMFEKIFFK